MRAAMHPVIDKWIPSPINQPRSSPYAIHIAKLETAIRDNIINNTRVIFRNIHIFFTNRLDSNIITDRHGNFVVTLQIAILLGDLAHSLHGVHHVRLLHFDSFAELIRPRGVL